MNTFDFTITIDQFVDDLDAIDAFYGRCDDVSGIATLAGVT